MIQAHLLTTNTDFIFDTKMYNLTNNQGSLIRSRVEKRLSTQPTDKVASYQM